MIITDSTVTLASSSIATSKYEMRESLRAWIGDTRPDFEGTNASQDASGVRVSLSDAGKQALAASGASGSVQSLDDIDEAVQKDPRTQLIKLIVEYLTGKKISFLDTSALQKASSSSTDQYATSSEDASTARAGYGIEYDFHESYSESATMNFSGSGVIHTADGQEITFDVSLLMQHQYATETNISIREGDAKKIDPLVLNFSGSGAQLANQKFSFDLNADGTDDSISFVQGAGFLTLDRNGDGIVNNGTELFGPNTGNGFDELQAYDEDGNHWIDENDSVYEKLKIWTKDADGKDILVSLKESHVGALYLGNVNSPFDIKNAQNELQGQVRSSGLWLTEEGQARSMQQIDLVA